MHIEMENCLNHKADDNMFTAFFRTRLVPYLQVAIARMKRDTLFLHKKTVVICKESMGDVN